MIKSTRKIYPIYVLIDLVFIALSFFLPYFIRYNKLSNLFTSINFPNFTNYLSIFLLWAIFIIIAFNLKKLYITDRSLTLPREISRVVIVIIYTTILVGAVIFFAKFKDFSRLVFLINFICLCLFLTSWRVIKRLALRRLVAKGFHNINVLIVGAGNTGQFILEEIQKNPWLGLNPIGFLDDYKEAKVGDFPILGKIEEFTKIAKKHFIDEAIVTIPSEKEPVRKLISQVKNLKLGLKFIPQGFPQAFSEIDIDYLGFVPLISYKKRGHHPAEYALKRIFDFFLSLFLLILLFPLFILISILIKATSEGPVFYKSKRVGLKGKLFNFYKFRSMVKNAEKLKVSLAERNEVKDGVIFKIKDDPRITPVGRLLRKFSLDELPQLFNVLKGEMSLVGPRPPTPDEVEKYDYQHMKRLSIRPGITGMSQVKGRSKLTFKRWVRWDSWYINNWSFGLDLRILWWTIFVVLGGKDAY
ncbi:MAG: sugar transferase [Candidatus Omnitrophica bacterium]|nr:sugar transferase [Candidatus Omnitrophota bacterium]